MKKLCIALCASLMLLAGSVTAKADVLDAEALVISNWDYSVDGIFTNWMDERGRTGNVTTNNASYISSGYALNTAKNGVSSSRVSARELAYDFLHKDPISGSESGYSSLRWGRDGAYSSIGIEKSQGTVRTDVAQDAQRQSLGVTLWHNNRAIDSNVSTLLSGTVLLTLNLQPVITEGMEAILAGLPSEMQQELAAALESMAQAVFATTMDFYFLETTNSGDYQSDIFIVKDPFEAATEEFTVAGVAYSFSFGASFEPLTGGYLALAQDALGADANTTLYGWVTAENNFTPIQTYLTVHYQTNPPPYPAPTPEPGTILLMGAGLVGLGVMIRRRRQQQ